MRQYPVIIYAHGSGGTFDEWMATIKANGPNSGLATVSSNTTKSNEDCVSITTT